MKSNFKGEKKEFLNQSPSKAREKKKKEKISGVINFDLTHVRHDPASCLAPGLFRSLKRGDRKKLKLDVTYHYGKKELIEFKGPYPLGADDLRVLQGLIALSGPDGIILKPEPKTEIGQELRRLLEPKWDATEKNALVIKNSYRKLAKEIGYSEDGGKVFKLIRDSIERLWTVSIIVQIGNRRMGFRLLSDYASDGNTGQLFVALNPRITEAILGDRPHTRIDMNEVRALKSDPARLIHQRLCGWIDPGKQGRIEMDTLISYVWPEETSKDSTVRMRRQTVRKALNEFRAIGWTVKEYVTNKFEVIRPNENLTGITATYSHTNVDEPPY